MTSPKITKEANETAPPTNKREEPIDTYQDELSETNMKLTRTINPLESRNKSMTLMEEKQNIRRQNEKLEEKIAKFLKEKAKFDREKKLFNEILNRLIKESREN